MITKQHGGYITLFNDLWQVYLDYVNWSVVENKEQKLIFFHVLLGTVLTSKGYSYIESAEPKSMRLHTFLIQDSGTGKTQLMKALYNLVKYLNIPARRTIKDNEAAMTGSAFRDLENNIIVKKGYLANVFLYEWDEGSILLKPSPFMDDATDVMQGVMDEPGMVSKGMKLAPVEYDTKATIATGSYMFDIFKHTLMTRGYLQRMFLYYKILNEQERKNIRIGVNLLKLGQNFAMIEKLKNAIKVLVDKIPPLKDGYITFNEQDVKKFNTDLENLYKNSIAMQYVGEKQTVLETFNNRLHILIDKIAAQKAIIEGKQQVTYEDLQYGLQVTTLHVKSLLELFDHFYGGKLMSYKDQRTELVINVIGRQSLTQQELLNRLKTLRKSGRWDLGFNRTLSFINDLITTNTVTEQRIGNKRILSCNS